MAEGRKMTAAQAVEKLMACEHADVIRESVAVMVGELIEAEVSAMIGAELRERAPERRTAQRNGYRERAWDTRVGELELQISKLRSGPAYFPGFLEPRRRAEHFRGREGGDDTQEVTKLWETAEKVGAEGGRLRRSGSRRGWFLVGGLGGLGGLGS